MKIFGTIGFSSSVALPPLILIVFVGIFRAILDGIMVMLRGGCGQMYRWKRDGRNIVGFDFLSQPGIMGV